MDRACVDVHVSKLCRGNNAIDPVKASHARAAMVGELRLVDFSPVPECLLESSPDRLTAISSNRKVRMHPLFIRVDEVEIAKAQER